MNFATIDPRRPPRDKYTMSNKLRLKGVLVVVAIVFVCAMSLPILYPQSVTWADAVAIFIILTL